MKIKNNASLEDHAQPTINRIRISKFNPIQQAVLENLSINPEILRISSSQDSKPVQKSAYNFWHPAWVLSVPELSPSQSCWRNACNIALLCKCHLARKYIYRHILGRQRNKKPWASTLKKVANKTIFGNSFPFLICIFVYCPIGFFIY